MKVPNVSRIALVVGLKWILNAIYKRKCYRRVLKHWFFRRNCQIFAHLIHQWFSRLKYLRSKWQLISISSAIDLAPNRHQSKISTDDGLVYDICVTCGCNWRSISIGSGGRFKNAYELLNLRALKISMVYKNHIFQCMGKIFCVEFQRVPLKFHTKYLTHTLKDIDFIHRWRFKSS